MNFLPERKYGVPSHNFVKKNVLCEKGDEITRFDGKNKVRSTSFAAGFDPTPLPPLASTGKDTQREEGLRERAGRKPLSLC
jgi:hypothetical protein